MPRRVIKLADLCSRGLRHEKTMSTLLTSSLHFFLDGVGHFCCRGTLL